jgi:hypothetical protein
MPSLQNAWAPAFVNQSMKTRIREIDTALNNETVMVESYFAYNLDEFLCLFQIDWMLMNRLWLNRTILSNMKSYLSGLDPITLQVGHFNVGALCGLHCCWFFDCRYSFNLQGTSHHYESIDSRRESSCPDEQADWYTVVINPGELYQVIFCNEPTGSVVLHWIYSILYFDKAKDSTQSQHGWDSSKVPLYHILQ